ncbi:MAG: hypothetical protein HY779_05185, partial [Rubrobacteridae bacterium]|nr:hypothetical protein [Rubrobacteridae bacterium]
MRNFLILAIVGFIITITLAKSVANEADPFLKIESKGITKTAQRSYILADNGKVITRFYTENREDVRLKDIPQNVQE